MPIFVLIHSPSVGPATWQPVADQLREAGHEVAVPSLLSVADGGAPFWPRVSSAVRAGLAGIDPSRPVVLVPHSNAGLFVPVIARDLQRPVACSVFADASVPQLSGSTPVVGDDFLPFLRGLADDDGLLPRWTDWWDADDVLPMLPDPEVREVIIGEQPRLPLAYYLDRVPARPAGTAIRADTCSSARAMKGWRKRRAGGAGRCGPRRASTCTRSSTRTRSRERCWSWPAQRTEPDAETRAQAGASGHSRSS